MNLPTIKQLRYFIALSNHKHFGRAAQSCYVSQSAFSVAIQELESLLGAQLVDRTNKHVTITRIGQEVAAHAQRCIRDVEYLSSIANRSQKGPLSNKLTLGSIPTIAPFLLPPLLPNLTKSYPHLQLYLVEDTTLNLYQQLMTGSLDILLLALPYDLPGVEIMPLFKDKFSLASRRNSRHINKANNDISQLSNESIILLEDGHCLRDHALSACKLNNSNSLNPFSASSLLTLIEMVNSDLGITFLTEMTLNSPMIKHTDITTTPINEGYREIGLVWRKNSAQKEEFEILGKYIKQCYTSNSCKPV